MSEELKLPENVTQLNTADPALLSFGLCGVTGSGKTLGAASFGGGAHGKVLFFNIEFGPKGGAGGATVLRYASDIYPYLLPSDVLVLDVRSRREWRETNAWVDANAELLFKQGFRLQVFDSGTELGELYKRGLTNLDSTKIKGASSKDEEQLNTRAQHKRELIPNIVGVGGRRMEFDDYELICDRVLNDMYHTKRRPFRTVWTYTPGPGYDPANTKKGAIGVGPELPGRVLPSLIPQRFDGFFFCVTKESQKMPGKWLYKWITGPNELGFIAKNRFGNQLEPIEPAGGVALLTKLGAVTQGAAAAQGEKR